MDPKSEAQFVRVGLCPYIYTSALGKFRLSSGPVIPFSWEMFVDSLCATKGTMASAAFYYQLPYFVLAIRYVLKLYLQQAAQLRSGTKLGG